MFLSLLVGFVLLFNVVKTSKNIGYSLFSIILGDFSYKLSSSQILLELG